MNLRGIVGGQHIIATDFLNSAFLHSLDPLPTLKVTTKEAARLMRLSNRTLEDWRVRGKGPPFCKLGAAVRYAQADVQLFLSAALRANTGGFPA